MQHKGEIEESEPEKLHKVEFAEYDVEKVLEEQETHDLFCPNCNSCITKRVILKKRKRTVRDSQLDLPPVKLLNVYGNISAVDEPEEVIPEDKEVFRCLSCFSFFTSTDGGFNIFRIFGKREETSSSVNSTRVPVRKSWVSSIFRSEASKMEGTGTGVPVPVESNRPSVHLSLNENQSVPTQLIKDPAHYSESYTITKYDDAGLPTSTESHSFSNQSSVNPSLEDNQSAPVQNPMGDTTYSENYTTITNDSSGVPASINSYSVSVTTTSAGSVQSTLTPKSPNTKDPVKHVENDSSNQKADAEDDLKKPLLDRIQPSILDGTIGKAKQLIGSLIPSPTPKPLGSNVIEPNGVVKPVLPIRITQPAEIIDDSVSPVAETRIHVGDQGVGEPRRKREWDILKSIVYGGLIESIASLSVVSSAAGAGSTTLNIVALGLANLIGGLLVITHDISELRTTPKPEATNPREKPTDRYLDLLGKRENVRRHVIISILSYIIFGLLPPVIYGFSFRNSDNKEYKLIAVAAASLICICFLAIGKAHVRSQKDYFKCFMYYLTLGVSASGLSYVAGVYIDKLLVELGVFDASAVSPPSAATLGFVGSGYVAPGKWTSI